MKGGDVSSQVRGWKGQRPCPSTQGTTMTSIKLGPYLPGGIRSPEYLSQVVCPPSRYPLWSGSVAPRKGCVLEASTPSRGRYTSGHSSSLGDLLPHSLTGA